MTKGVYVAAGAGLVLAGFAAGADAQTIDNNFSRDRSTAVLERAHPEYAPLGLRLGAFNVNPSLGVGLGFNDNVFYTSTNKKADAFLELAPTVKGQTTWSRHALSFNVGAVGNWYSKQTSENATAWDALFAGRLDISSASSLSGSISHGRSYELRSSYEANPNESEPVPIDRNRIAVDLVLVGNRLKFQGGLSQTDLTYHDVTTIGGAPLPMSYRNFKTSIATARADYAISPSISVFLATEANQRRYDVSTKNDSDGLILAVGSSFELGALVRGTVQLGTIQQDYKNLAVGKVSSGYANAKVEWFPTEITTVTGTISRSYYDTPTSATTATPTLYSSTAIVVDHELLRNLVLSAGLKFSTYEPKSINRKDRSHSLDLGARYLVNRRVTLVAGYGYEKYTSKGSARNFTDNSAKVSVLLQY